MPQSDAEEASLKVANATKDIEVARKDAAEANARAAEANLRLEQFKAPRRLTEEQHSALLNAAGRWPRTKFDLAIKGSDPEASALAIVLETTLLAAGWEEVAYSGSGDVAIVRPGKPTIGIINLDGVAIQTRRPTGDAASAARLLGEILNSAGIRTMLANGPSTNLEGVRVWVGKKSI